MAEPSCGLYQHGQSRNKYRNRYEWSRPNSTCVREVQRQICICDFGTFECTDWFPNTYQAVSCFSGCGDVPHKYVRVKHNVERFSYICEKQIQVKGEQCSGNINGNTNGTWKNMTTWCILGEGGMCDDDSILHPFDNCSHPDSPPPLTLTPVPSLPPPSPISPPLFYIPPPPAQAESVNSPPFIIVPLVVVAGLGLGAVLCVFRRKRRRTGNTSTIQLNVVPMATLVRQGTYGTPV
jgi:hypothetical protein